ncbi:hypothetical protein [Chryseobacterium sp. MDT2-18]|uniref:hypothetical protein n=1 Tax=Chryseobacterium sp. MDT2-18 TaxID=1259136 RepID=UPI002780AE6B|nr:hypothetical protein [Chryseobacterium sp. MDT2-18]MDQ0478276.1 hypothetical protein [Chryseobacterium sp. MDT2-18]
MRKYTPLALLLSCQFFNGQNTPSNNNLDFPNIIVPTQETFASSRINFEPSSNGLFIYQYSIEDKIKMPVFLNYISGVKVDDAGGSIGCPSLI